MIVLFILEEGFIGKLRQLIVVIRIPHPVVSTAKVCFRINARLMPMLNGVGVNLHARSSDGLAIGQVDDTVHEILQCIPVSNLNVNGFFVASESGYVGRSKRGEKHQQHQEYWLCFSVCFV